jgi:Zn-dependent peptidase ImmA (M78 family)
MRITDLFESRDNSWDLMQVLEDFLPLAMEELEIDKLPKIKLVPIVKDTVQPTFGKFVNDENKIYLGIEERHPLDVIRTLAHELVHFKQGMEHRLDDTSGNTGSPIENEAHEVAGIIMRNFNKRHPEYFKLSAVDVQ